MVGSAHQKEVKIGNERPEGRPGSPVRPTETIGLGDAPQRPVWLLAPGSVIGERYEVRSVLGTGGFAVVYHVHDRELERDIALKVLRPERFIPSTLKRLRREVAIARDVESPRLLRVYDVGRSENAVYLSMELVTGGTLADRLERDPLPIDDVIRLGGQILEGLADLHAVGIVHRDIKPGNVLLTPEGDVKLGDFGIARRLDTAETRMTIGERVLGTIDYLSPEQARGLDTDARSDLYAAGIVLYEMLTGEVPWSDSHGLGRLSARMENRPTDVRRRRPETPAWLARLVARLLEPQPTDRYPDARAARQAFLQHRVTSRRRRRWGMLATATVLVLAVGGGILWWIERPRFAELRIEDGYFAGLDARGNELWRVKELELEADRIESSVALARLRSGGPHRVLSLVATQRPVPADGSFDDEAARTLVVFDRESGDPVRTVLLPGPPGDLADFGTWFQPRTLAVEDLDEDGVDEVLVTFRNRPSYPAYTILWEPLLARTRVVHVGSGHQSYSASSDLDGDGIRELLFVGVNNPLGWYQSVAAVRIVPAVNLEGGSVAARSPDQPQFPNGQGTLLWYTLLPRGAPLGAEAVVDRSRERIQVRYPDGRVFEVGYDGSLHSSEYRVRGGATPDRSRRLAWQHVNAALRLLRGRIWDQAALELAAAEVSAADAGSVLLVECVRRLEAKRRILAGETAAGLALFENLLANGTHGAIPEITFDAADALHLAGENERAVEWYRRGLGRSSVGKPPFEFLEGLVLALVELGRFDDAKRLVTQFQAGMESTYDVAAVDIYNSYVDWRVGRLPEFDERRFADGGAREPIRYWLLEFRNARGDSPRSLLPRVETELELTADCMPMLMSLKAELLARMGRRDEANRIAREAWTRMQEMRFLHTTPYSHRDLVRERYERITDRAAEPV